MQEMPKESHTEVATIMGGSVAYFSCWEFPEGFIAREFSFYSPNKLLLLFRMGVSRADWKEQFGHVNRTPESEEDVNWE